MSDKYQPGSTADASGTFDTVSTPGTWSVTLNSLKDELYSLNMRLLLAMQNHSQEAQEDTKRQIAAVQAEIDRMSLGRYVCER